MLETPETTEERRLEDLRIILNGRPGAAGETRYGRCLINKRRDTFELRIVGKPFFEPLMIFFIDSLTGKVKAQTEGEYVKVWKDERRQILLTPEDIIADFQET